MLGTVLVTVVAAAAPHVNHRPVVKHAHGCNTRACDRRIGRWLARWKRAHEMTTATASYYNDSGSTACGTHATYGFAHLGPGEDAEGWTPPGGGMACGTEARICAQRCVTATMDDHGPYVPGREYDLNETTKSATGASDLGTIRVHVMR